MKRFSYFVMGLISAATFTLTSCSSSDDINGGNKNELVDGVYMTLTVSGPNANNKAKTRTDGTEKENGTETESKITEGTLYIYKGTTCVFKRTLTKDDWKTAPTETASGETRPIKVSVNTVNTEDTYNVYFMANKTDVADPLEADAKFAASSTGGADYATDNTFVMFNQNDKSNPAAHSTVKFKTENQSESNPAKASEIKLDRVVARIDAPTVSATAIEGSTATTNVAETISGIEYVSYATSNLNNNSFIIQNWNNNFADLVVDNSSLYKNYDAFGSTYTANTDLFTTNAATAKTYAFENTTTDATKATALYFSIKGNLTDAAKNGADFNDGTFYRYDGKIYTKIADIYADAEKGIVANPFNVNGNTPEAANVVKSLKKEDGTLIDEGETLANFRETHKIQIFRAGIMYYRWAITDSYYKTNTDPTTYSVLRNSIYRLNVKQVSEIGKDVPNGPEPADVNPNYYMTVTVTVNPWILNTQNITLK